MRMINRVSDIRTVMVAGAGTLGMRIALRCALDGYQVIMFDTNAPQLDRAQRMQARLVRGLLKSGKVTQAQVDRLTTNLCVTSDMSEAVKDIDLISESIIEDVDIKNAFYADLTPRLEPGVIVTTNTSFLLASQFLNSVKEPELFCALHFHDVFSQVVVDVMPHPTTSTKVVDILMAFGKSINQIPVFVQKENPGYMFNAMLMSILGQAADLLGSGVGSIQDIDRSFMGNFGVPAGPFGMMDQVGLDTVWHIVNAQNDERSKAFAAMVRSYIDQGKLGYKSGEGFYKYPGAEFTQADFLKP